LVHDELWASETLTLRRCIVLEPHGSGVHLAARADGQRLVKLRPAGFDPADEGASLAQAGIPIGPGHVVPHPPRFTNNPAVTIDPHRIARANFVVVLADTIGKHQKHAIVVRSRRQPPHQPAATFVPLEFGSKGLRVLLAPLPEPNVDRYHRTRAA